MNLTDLPLKQGLFRPPQRARLPAASASSPTSRARSRTTSSVRACRSLVNLDHRGAVGADPLVGDGAGCMIQTPDALLRDWAEDRASTCPSPATTPSPCASCRRRDARAFAVERLEHFIKSKADLVGWRDVPTDTTGLGTTRHRAHAGDQDGDRRPRPRPPTRTPSSASSSPIRKQTQNPLVDLEKKHAARPVAALHAVLLDPHRGLQGPAARGPRSASFYDDLRIR